MPLNAKTLARRTVVGTIGEEHARSLWRRSLDAQALASRSLTRTGRRESGRVTAFRNLHLGGRCVIIGNGPSLNETPVDLLGEQYTFGLNRIYLMQGQLGFTPTFHVAVNRLVVEQCSQDLLKIPTPLFTTTPNRQFLKPSPNNVYYLQRLGGPRFSGDISRGVWEGATVTYVALQIALYMGFRKAILIGVDHRFFDQGSPHKEVQSTGPDRNHFDANYFGRGFRWQLPDLETSEAAYALARRAFEDRGGKVIDATVGGALQVFEKMTLEDALDG